MEDYKVGGLAALISGKMNKIHSQAGQKLNKKNKANGKSNFNGKAKANELNKQDKKSKSNVNEKQVTKKRKLEVNEEEPTKKAKKGKNTKAQNSKNKKPLVLRPSGDDEDMSDEANESEEENVSDAENESEDENMSDEANDSEKEIESNKSGEEESKSDDENESDGEENTTSEITEASEIKTDSEDSDDEEDGKMSDEEANLDDLLKEESEEESNEEDESDAENDEDDDAKVQIKATEKSKKTKADPKDTEVEEERNRRTVFVGNLPVHVTKTNVKKIFKKFGMVESVRLRCVPVSDTRVPKKVALIKKDFHPDRTSLHAYVRYQTVEEAVKALKANGVLYKNTHHLRVNLAQSRQTQDQNKSLFVGNIPFDAEEEELWKAFESCGEIQSVRLIRDGRTMIGKGFGYVNFASADSVELALEMPDIKIRNRELRIKRSDSKAANKTKSRVNEKRSKSFKRNKPKGSKPQNILTTATTEEKPKSITVQNKIFQGKTANKKKDKKIKKKMDEKKKLAKQIAPKEG